MSAGKVVSLTFPHPRPLIFSSNLFGIFREDVECRLYLGSIGHGLVCGKKAAKIMGTCGILFQCDYGTK